MKKILLPLLLGLAISAHACDSVVVKVEPLTYTENHQIQFSELERITSTGTELGAVVTTSSVGVTDQNGVCTVDVGFINTTVYVSSELHRNACAEEHVTIHEHHHLKIYQDALQALPVEVVKVSAGLKTAKEIQGKVVSLLHNVIQQQNDFDEEDLPHNVTACHGEIMRILRLNDVLDKWNP